MKGFNNQHQPVTPTEPYYKKFWFWIAVIFIFYGNISTLRNVKLTDRLNTMDAKINAMQKSKTANTSVHKPAKSSADSTPSNDTDIVTDTSTNKSAVLKLNQAATIYQEGSSNKSYSITLTSVSHKLTGGTYHLEKGDDTSLFDDGKPANVVEIKYSYTNFGYDDPLFVSSDDFTLYDDDGNAADVNGSQDSQTKITKGHSTKSTSWYVLQKPYSQCKFIEVEIIDFLSNDSFMYKIPVNQ